MIVWLWVAFIALVLFLLALDLGVFNREAHVISGRESVMWTTAWVSLALLFNALVYPMYEHHWLGIGLSPGYEASGREAALKFFTGFIIEKSLSLDNIFVIAMIMQFFRVPGRYQHRLLFWGVLGALVMRGAMIGLGVTLIHMFDWVTYLLGALLIFTAGQMLLGRQEGVDPEKNALVRLVRRFYPVTTDIRGPEFFTRMNGRRAATPMLLALVVVETSDLLFAVDSIPAIFAVTTDPFLVFTSNVFAILGLRSLYFLLAAVLDRFRYLQISLVFVLAFVGVKLLLTHHFPIPVLISLAVIASILLAGVLASWVAGARDGRQVRS